MLSIFSTFQRVLHCGEILTCKKRLICPRFCWISWRAFSSMARRCCSSWLCSIWVVSIRCFRSSTSFSSCLLLLSSCSWLWLKPLREASWSWSSLFSLSSWLRRDASFSSCPCRSSSCWRDGRHTADCSSWNIRKRIGGSSEKQLFQLYKCDEWSEDKPCLSLVRQHLLPPGVGPGPSWNCSSGSSTQLLPCFDPAASSSQSLLALATLNASEYVN